MIPVLKIELENMKEVLLVALSNRLAEQDIGIQEAVSKFCTEGNLASIVDNAVKVELKSAIEAEIRNFFSYGDGRKVVMNVVKQTLAEIYKEDGK